MDSPFMINIHHILPTSSLDIYGDQISTLFGGAENDPFHVDSNFNKIALPESGLFASALAQVQVKIGTAFANLGLNAHSGGFCRKVSWVVSIQGR